MLELQNVKKVFGKKNILKNVSFSLKKGSINVLMGTNGSGKTLLLNIISGFIVPDFGSVLVNKKKINGILPNEINKLGVVRIFQDLRLIEEFTVIENVMFSFKNQEGEKWWEALFFRKKVQEIQKFNKAEAIKILSVCFISDIGHLKASDISYGQQKLLTIACCLANGADIILLDEPVAGINPLFVDKLAAVVKKLKELNKIVLIVEHNTDFVKSVADRILFLNQGKINIYSNYEAMEKDDEVKNSYI